jgi:hypothetical protein
MAKNAVVPLPAVLRGKIDAFASEHRPVVWQTREFDGGRGEYDLWILGSDPGAFDVGAEIRTYGIYPLLGGRPLGWSWDVVSDFSIEQICAQFLSLVRATLSEDCRLRRTLLRGEVYDWVIEAASPHGWQIVDSRPRGWFRRWRWRNRQDVTEQILQNRLLPPVGFAEGRDTWDNFVFRRHEA